MKKSKIKSIKLSVNLKPTNEIFKLNQISLLSLIRDLRSESEIASGIPANIQHLYYLDKCDLVDSTTVQNNDIISNSILTMDIWHVWRDLITAAARNEITKVFSMGVTQNSDFSTPSSKILFEKEKRLWLQERANIALIVAAHRGHMNLCSELIKHGANVNWPTKLGRTALHFAAAQDKSDIIDLLLHKGADINIKDSNGFTPLTLANKYGHKNCERHLFMFRWQQRAKNMETKYLNPPMMAFQMFDSSLPKWKTGPAAQFYCENLLPPGEFIGSSINAPKRNYRRRYSSNELLPLTFIESNDNKEEFTNAEKMEHWLKRKTIQQKINEEIKKKKEDSERLIKEERRIQNINKWKKPENVNGKPVLSNEEILSPCSKVESNGNLKPAAEMKTRIKDLLLTYGLKNDSNENSPSQTVYDQWLQQRKNMGKPVNDEDMSLYAGYLPYQHMIREFCFKKCHH